MTDYAEVDPVIDAWAQVTVKKVFTEWAGRPARFAYLPGLRAFECFQIWVGPPSADRIVVSAASVDTDDTEHFRTWEGPVDCLAAMLDDATDAVQGWITRPLA